MKEKENQKKSVRKKNPAAVLKGKEVHGDKGKVLRQYPPEVGFHGSDKESELSPEE